MSTSIRYLRLHLHVPDQSRRAIGYLSQYGDLMRVSFDEDYIQDAQRPTLSLAYMGGTEADTRAILAAQRDERVARSDAHWPVYFQNLLPEGHNRERLALERRCTVDNEFELLAAAGHDLMGAVEVMPVAPQLEIPQGVRHWHTALGLDVLEPGFVEEPVEDAASLPGIVTKFSAVQDGRRYIVQRRGGYGGRAGDTILKLPTTAHPDLVANEFTGYQLCHALGLDCAKASIISREQADLPRDLPFNEILAVQRFDRAEGGQRIHMEEFAQVLGYAPRHKYGKGIAHDYLRMLMLLDRYSSRPAIDVLEFARRFTAFILMGNTDAHLKNWALIYPDARHPQLAPLYDPVCVSAFFENVPISAYAINRAINRAVDKTLRTFTWADFSALLKQAGLLRHSSILRKCKELMRVAQSDWPALLKDAPLAVRRSVQERLNGGVALSQSQ
jgi:serine/threonine-protein kinase HipA